MSSGFVTEAEIQEKRRLRQEQWEKVRKPEEPSGNLLVNYTNNIGKIPSTNFPYHGLEVPEEPADTRSLYDRLKEQKDRKQEEFEESHKFSNECYLIMHTKTISERKNF